MIRRESDGARVSPQVGKAQRPRIDNQRPQNSTTNRLRADRISHVLIHPMGEEPVEAPAGLIEHSQRPVTGTGELARELHQSREQILELQAARDGDPGLEEQFES